MLAATMLILIWTALGYPALMAFLSIVRSKPHERDHSHTCSAAVIVPACNEAKSIDARLANLLDLSPLPLRIIVVTDGSTDSTEESARMRDDPRITVLGARTRKGKLAAINRGIQTLEGHLDSNDLVVLTDANTAFDDDTLAKLMPHFADPLVGSVSTVRCVSGGRVLHRWLHWYESRLLAWESRVGSAVGAAGELLAIRYCLARTLCANLSPSTVNDDFALAMGVVGAGKRHIFDGDLVAAEPISIRRREELGRRIRISAGRARDLRRLFRWSWVRDQPWIASQVLSHKGLRLLLPVAVLPVIGETIGARGLGAALLGVACVLTAAGLLVDSSNAERARDRRINSILQMIGDGFVFWAGGLIGLVCAAFGHAPWPRSPR
ncbi:MAG: hypothetical protein CME06_06700 [Gemmatimonadetes bacterium]|nr:hypothetical protein [Gemmatimonadota bacterium]